MLLRNDENDFKWKESVNKKFTYGTPFPKYIFEFYFLNIFLNSENSFSKCFGMFFGNVIFYFGFNFSEILIFELYFFEFQDFQIRNKE